MPGIVKFSANTVWPVSLDEAKNFLKINVTDDDNLIQKIIIPAATIYVENAIGKQLASRDFIQFQDSFPFYPYSREPYGTLYGIGALSLYFGYGPITPTPFPPFGMNTGERLPFQIDLLASPVTNVDHIDYVDASGNPAILHPGTDFSVDLMSTVARITPLPGSIWPQCTIGPNNVRIYLTAGMQNEDLFSSPPVIPTVDVTDTTNTPPEELAEQKYINNVPEDLKVAVMMMITQIYFNRETVVSGNAVSIPHGLDAILGMNKKYDFSIGLR